MTLKLCCAPDALPPSQYLTASAFLAFLSDCSHLLCRQPLSEEPLVGTPLTPGLEAVCFSVGPFLLQSGAHAVPPEDFFSTPPAAQQHPMPSFLPLHLPSGVFSLTSSAFFCCCAKTSSNRLLRCGPEHEFASSNNSHADLSFTPSRQAGFSSIGSVTTG